MFSPHLSVVATHCAINIHTAEVRTTTLLQGEKRVHTTEKQNNLLYTSLIHHSSPKLQVCSGLRMGSILNAADDDVFQYSIEVAKHIRSLKLRKSKRCNLAVKRYSLSWALANWVL